MPVYEYSCKTCGNHFDKLRPMRDADELILCVNCQSADTHRMLSRVFAHSEGRSMAESSSSSGSSCSCGGCSGGSCGSCRN